ncbi:hypothetical protein D3C74_276340 [compost metagenome]
MFFGSQRFIVAVRCDAQRPKQVLIGKVNCIQAAGPGDDAGQDMDAQRRVSELARYPASAAQKVQCGDRPVKAVQTFVQGWLRYLYGAVIGLFWLGVKKYLMSLSTKQEGDK